MTLINILEYAEIHYRTHKPRVLFTSSNEAYAGLESLGSLPIPTPENVPLVIENPRNPRWSYGGSKLAGELLVHAYAAQYDVPAVIVRPHNFYGPRAGDGHVIPQMIERIRKREDPFKIPGAEQTRSFCYIDDAIDGLILAMSYAHEVCPTFHIGTQAEIPMHALAHLLFDICKWTPERVERVAAPRGSVNRRCPDTSVMNSLGWHGATSLPEGLRATVAWHLARAAPTG
jgi:nucleoside-diphosphate-sugar epimerase